MNELIEEIMVLHKKKKEKKKTQIASLEKEEQSCKYQIPDFKIYYKTVVIKAPA